MWQYLLAMQFRPRQGATASSRCAMRERSGLPVVLLLLLPCPVLCLCCLQINTCMLVCWHVAHKHPLDCWEAVLFLQIIIPSCDTHFFLKAALQLACM